MVTNDNHYEEEIGGTNNIRAWWGVGYFMRVAYMGWQYLTQDHNDDK